MIGTNVTSVSEDAFYACGSLISITIPNSVTSIGMLAFYACTNLINVMIPNSVTNIGDEAFFDCFGLTSVYFQGNAPSADSAAFYGDTNVTAYYLPGTTGWSGFSADTGVPAVLWNPQVQTSGPALACGRMGSASPSPAPATWSSWWKPARTWPIPYGLRWGPTPSPAARPISATRSGRIIPPVSTASARREEREGQSFQFFNV